MQDILIKALEEQDTLCHHGILGQKWGVRRYQNPDGSLTDEGRKRYGRSMSNKKAGRYREKMTNNIPDKTLSRYSGEYKKAIRSDDYEKLLTVEANFINDMTGSNYTSDTLQSHEADMNGLVADLRAKLYKYVNEEIDKERQSTASSRKNEYSKQMEADGWVRDRSFDNYDKQTYSYYEKELPFGDTKVKFSTSYEPYHSDDTPQQKIKDNKKFIDYMQKNAKEIQDKCREFIAEDLYDDGTAKDWDQGRHGNLTRDKFMSLLKPVVVQDNGTLWFTDDDVFGGHWHSVDYDVKNNKPLYSSLTG